MPNIRGFQQSFNGGVVTPEFWGRLDDPKYQTGLAVCDNFIVLPHGPVTNCPGSQFVRAAKYASTMCRLIPFTYSTTQTVVIEMGAGYFRFHSGGQTVMLSGSPYEIANPYAEADLFQITFVQSADVLTLCHPNYAPRELRRTSATSWTLSTISFGPNLSTPTSLTATAVRGSPASTATKNYSYVVTTATADGKSESPQSAVAIAYAQNLLDSGAYNTVSWAAVSGATRYHIYRQSGGLYGFMGAATTTSFTDDGSIIPDTGFTPPLSQTPFATDYPGAVSYFEQRRMFGGTIANPQKVWGTRSGTESDLNYAIPTRDDDAISFKVASRDVNTIRHIVPMQQVILLTSGGVWRLTSVNSDAITPSSISVAPQSGVGANTAQPVVDDTTALYVSARGGHIRELGFNWQVQGFVSNDLSLRAPNLFDGFDITQLAFQRAPAPVMWGVSTTGDLIGMTYVPEQEVRALWTRSTTNGTFESVCVVAEGVEDRVYVVVRRTINGSVVRYIERLAPRLWSSPASCVFVDCAGTYNGTPTKTISGLTWLEGQTVNILADGAVMPQQVVTAGKITLPEAASVVQAGLPLVSQIQTLPASFMQAPGAGQGRPKNVNRVFFRVNSTGGIKAGPDTSNLVEAKVRTTESPGSPPNLVTDEIEVVMMPSWGDGGQFIVYHDDPLPMTLLSMTPEFAVGS
ncbi:hypothetical protein UFOVP152_11 [uncultured Caudovirales phage]|uniref:Ubiquitin-activating enzyme E1 FCCH domain-containing protein n=1 Tax=uncultured Caudovirales phage TaxID=2100421 RepID=A0A6J7WDL0_9CAUD|nr:hypothetical protein UFOVP152_11 [uncultured Caudovirales phage]